MVITVTNPSNNPGNLMGVSISDTYTGTLVNNAAGSVVCSGAGNATLSGGVNGGTVVGFTNGTIVPGGTCSITQSVTATSTVSNTTGAPSTTGPAALSGLPVGPVMMTITPAITQNFASTNISSGSNTNLTVTIGNSNTSPITLSSIFTNTFPVGMTIGTAGNTGTCTGVTATAGAGSFVIANGTSIPSGGCTVIVNVTSSTVGTSTNTIACGALQTSTGSNVSSSIVTLNVYATSSGSMSVSVSFYSGDPTSIIPGQTTRLQIILSNSSNVPVTGVVFSSFLPGSLPNGLKVAGALTYTCTDPNGPSTSAGVGILTANLSTQNIALSDPGGVIPAHANNTDGTCTIVIPVTAGTSTGNSTIYTVSDCKRRSSGFRKWFAYYENIGTVAQSVNITALTPPTISKSFVAGTLTLGGNSTTLTITVTNTNSISIPNFSITDAFPQLGGAAIIRVAATPGASANCNNGGGVPTFNPSAGDTSITGSGTIPAKLGATNGSCTFAVKVEAAQTNNAYSTGAQANTIKQTNEFQQRYRDRADF